MELSNIKGTVGNVIKNNIDKINASYNKEELYRICEESLIGLKNKDVDNFLQGIKKSKTHASALMYVYNYLFKGDNLGVI